ncbi:YcgL domain-containing protein [Alteromonas sp. CYL-A6]|uniref:YcgL domain-containing protein n=1 Tax=Alteromonas nitratireducens TaxID=3390813 RepID=UPI0034B965EF
MIIAVYKTRKKQGMYLYIKEKDKFDDVPDALMASFGTPELVMLLALNKREKLAGVDKDKLVASLNEKGFYLQMPPKEEDLLATHREQLGLSPQPEKR